MKFSVALFALFALTLTSVSSFLAPIPSRAFLASKLYSEEGEDASAVPVEETADEPEAVAVAEPEPEPERWVLPNQRLSERDYPIEVRMKVISALEKL